MTVEVIQQKLLSYKCETIFDQENALKEIAQEIALMSLSRSGFFRIAAFQGGTCLRILYGLERFSEDLDFALETPDKDFNWEPYIKNMSEEFKAYGYTLEAINKTKLDRSVKTTFLKADSTGGVLILKDTRTNRPKIVIKLEIDTNPPQGSEYELKYLDFPLSYSVLTHNLSSLFAGKCHALLCREYVKGRDWYDFVWYVARSISPNFSLLGQALYQQGPWANQLIKVTPRWFTEAMKQKILNMDWEAAKKDVARFLQPQVLSSLNVWSTEFFLSRMDKLSDYLK